jgi:hypothetical protein
MLLWHLIDFIGWQHARAGGGHQPALACRPRDATRPTLGVFTYSLPWGTIETPGPAARNPVARPDQAVRAAGPGARRADGAAIKVK